MQRDAHLNDVVQRGDAAIRCRSEQNTDNARFAGRSTQQSDLRPVGVFLPTGPPQNNPAALDGDGDFCSSKAPVTYSVSPLVARFSYAPKRFDVQPGTTAYDLIKMAGGLTTDADRASIYIQPSGSLDRVPFNYDFARTSPQSGDVNPVLKDGDKIVIPEEATVPVFSITGAVPKAGPIRAAGQTVAHRRRSCLGRWINASCQG